MKQAIQKLSMLVLAAALIAPVSLLAQEDKEKEAKEKEKEVKERKDVEQYIITRKGDSKEKMVIEINGDKIIVNGKAVEEGKDGDVTVKRMKIRELSGLTRIPRTGNWNMNDGQGMTIFNENTNHAMLGVTTEKTEQGVEVKSVTKESAAEKAGLKEGDVITKIDDKDIDSPDELSKAIRAHKPGEKVSVSYLRNKKEQKATAELTKWKGVNSFSMNSDHDFKMDMDLKFDNVMPKLQAPFGGQNWSWSGGQPKLGLSIQDTDDGKGVKVIEVDEESNAAKAGLKDGDVITEVDGKAVNGADEMAKVIKESKDKPSVMMKLQRGGKTQNVEVKIPRKIKTADL